MIQTYISDFGIGKLEINMVETFHTKEKKNSARSYLKIVLKTIKTTLSFEVKEYFLELLSH